MKGSIIGILSCLVLVMVLALGHVLADGSFRSASPSEVAVLSGTLNDGQTIPLPTYEDGTPAAESECCWFVSTNFQSFTELGHQSNTIELTCKTEGRTVRCFSERDATTIVAGTANYMIIAVRAAGQEPAYVPEPDDSSTRTTWGGVKARFGN